PSRPRSALSFPTRRSSDLLHPVDSPTAPTDCDLVIEAVREDLQTKRELFSELEKVCPQRTVFATTTSSLPVTSIAAALADPSRLDRKSTRLNSSHVKISYA